MFNQNILPNNPNICDTELTAVGWAIDVDSVYQAVHDDVEFGGDLDD